jgi:hypothetical protein
MNLKACLFAMLGALLLAFCLMAGCDCGDDDDDDSSDDGPTCETFCEKAAECETPCIEGDCADFCFANLSQAELECAALSQCGQFNSCLCGSDDDDDDDSGDDDDDDDDDTTSESYIYDDGVNEKQQAGVQGDTYAITMTPSGYPAHLTEVSFYNSSTIGDPAGVKFVILADQDSDGPEDQEIVFTSDIIVPSTPPSWVSLDLTTTKFDATLASGSWIVGVEQTAISVDHIGIDQSTETPQSYRGAGSGWFEGTAWGGIYMIRGEGYYEN